LSLRRALFEADQKKRARQNGLEMSKTAEFWFRRKYNLPPNDPRFLDLTVEDVLTEYYAHTYFDDPSKAQNEVVDDDFDVDAELAQINAEAEEELSDDPDDWEELD
jgi:hypothetical protein